MIKPFKPAFCHLYKMLTNRFKKVLQLSGNQKVIHFMKKYFVLLYHYTIFQYKQVTHANTNHGLASTLRKRTAISPGQ